MKMKHVILTLMAFALVVAMAPNAEAICIPGKTFGTWDSTIAYYYVTGWNGNPATTVGAFWQAGARADANEGTYDVAEWLRRSVYGDYLTGQISAGTVGCVTGEMILVLTQDNGDGTASFAVSRETEKTSGLNFFQADMTFTPIPRPRVTNSSRAGAQVVVDVALDGAPAAFSSRTGGQADTTISSFVLLSSHGVADAGRGSAAWTEIGRLGYTNVGGALPGVAVDCADDGGDTFLAVGLEVDGVLLLDHVSGSTALECDPTLADPDDKFDIIRDRGRGNKKGRPFNER